MTVTSDIEQRLSDVEDAAAATKAAVFWMKFLVGAQTTVLMAILVGGIPWAMSVNGHLREVTVTMRFMSEKIDGLPPEYLKSDVAELKVRMDRVEDRLSGNHRPTE